MGAEHGGWDERRGMKEESSGEGGGSEEGGIEGWEGSIDRSEGGH